MAGLLFLQIYPEHTSVPYSPPLFRTRASSASFRRAPYPLRSESSL